MPPLHGPAPLETASVAIVGAACRLPGARNETEFWRLLDEGSCAVNALPDNRWQAARYLHPRKSEPGFSYSFAGGYIDEPFGFDPGVFGISPREAAEMDPQQRLLLEVVWEALEDSGLPPSAVAGRNIGVYVGASSLDYGNLHTADPASIDSHFMTGNTLSILSNRISYIFDLRGPSFTVDTACSSSLVAFAEAQAAIASGRIDMAIVAGVNLLLSPTSFIGFSRASMLSPTGLCRPFSALADGYVRGEGVVAMVLAGLPVAVARHYPIRAVAVASGMNSDGRTNGISLPATEGQKELLDRLYGGGAIDPDRLAFIEAHGTGTRVGDPAEATAIGEALGRRRNATLPIGSVKSNIGHLEPASGLAGLYKAVLALEHRVLPASLHGETLNSAIDFAGLNLALATTAVTLPQAGTWFAGVSSFGFGGTNAHVVIRHAEPVEQPAARSNGAAGPSAELLILSAHSSQALRETAAAYSDMIENGSDVAALAAAVAWQRDTAGHRLAMTLSQTETLATSLRGFARTGQLADGVIGVAPTAPRRICFVYSGNGSQWAGMGRAAFARNAAFRSRFGTIDRIFGELAGWSLTEALHSETLSETLKQTRVAQPLLFAVQSSLTAALAEMGLVPDMTLGHSVGEVAAAQAAGALDLAEAIRVIFHRSEHQELVRGLGGMAVANLPPGDATALIEQVSGDLDGGDGLEVAAVNSPGSVTISGPADAIRSFARAARKIRVAVRVLDLAYPFHSALLEPIRLPLLGSLGRVASRDAEAGFISTVTGDVLAGDALDADYWWRNVREPVLFRQAIESAFREAATLFIEIGPRPILTANIADTLSEAGHDGAVMPSLVEKETAQDPVAMIVARALVLGAAPDPERVFGHRPASRMHLPPYAWQRKDFQQPRTSEALDLFGNSAGHPLIGTRLLSGAPEWRNLIDATLVPYLADHQIDGEIVVPGTAFAEMALAVAREIYKQGPIGLEDFDLLQWLPLQRDSMRELSVRYHDDTRVVEIRSRPRLAQDDWVLHARGRITQVASPAPDFLPREQLPHRLTSAEVYAAAAAAGVEYGPSFQLVAGAERSETLIEADLLPLEYRAGTAEGRQILHPIALDAAFHAMFENIKQRASERYAYLPIRFAALRVDQDHAIPARARTFVQRETDQSISIDVALYDKDDRFIASLTGGLFRAIVLDRRIQPKMLFQTRLVRLRRHDDSNDPIVKVAAALRGAPAPGRPEYWLLLEAFARSLAYRCLRDLAGYIHTSPAELVSRGVVAASSQSLVATLLGHLYEAGLADTDELGWLLNPDSTLPEPGDILRTFTAECPGAISETVLAAQSLAGLAHSLATGETLQIRRETRELFEVGSIVITPVLQQAVTVCTTLMNRPGADPLRVLVAEPGCLGLLQVLAPLVRQGLLELTVFGVDARRLSQAAARYGSSEGVTYLADTSDADGDVASGFDLGLALAIGPLFEGQSELGVAMSRRLSHGGMVCIVLPPPNPIFDVLLGTSADWYGHDLLEHGAESRIAAAQHAARMLVSSGFHAVEECALADQTGSLLLARPDARPAHPHARTGRAHTDAAPLVVIGTGNQLLANLVRQHDAGADTILVHPQAAGLRASWPDLVANLAASECVDVVWLGATGEPGGLARSLDDLAVLLTTVQHGQCRVWIVVRGMDAQDFTGIDPNAEAIWSFGRVAMNEFTAVDLRLVDIDPALSADVASRHFAELVAGTSGEKELRIDAAGVSAYRVAAGSRPRAADTPVQAVRLKPGSRGAQAKFDWVETSRIQPAATEIEVEIKAAGLNFRDVMLAMGLLDDDVLDDGLAGAVLGFECAGRVARVGSEIQNFKVGDAVMGFGRESFASYSTADARIFTPVPHGVSIEAAASIPVAFLTAWYSLVHLARIQPGEWVLIHGAAGGVGLAAIQIARMHGARVAATVGSPDKHALVELFGAEKIYNSRNSAFQDQIQSELGGVDVVLNSLAGELMQASVKCLKPFGRFIELGKRDYVLNTALGLRPFRRNLTYYGVDLDQLLAANLPLANRLMADIGKAFASGSLFALPHRVFDWFETERAFQIMQNAGHVGKLVVRPATKPVATDRSDRRYAAGPGAHLVVGGTGGFGFEAASWLAERGARTIVVASRSGHADPRLSPRIAALAAGGTNVTVAKLDVTDDGAVQALIDGLIASHGRIAGIMHTAVVMHDGMIAGMTPDRTKAVLAAKVQGAANLDRATRGASIDYFVAFSSASVMIGNPGQGAYVAANGYLQGLMRRRTAEGLPGLAVGWGAIADAGILARDPDVAARLERVSGIVAMPAATALRQLDDLLSNPADHAAAVYCVMFRPGAALQSLKLLQTPTFAGLLSLSDAIKEDGGIDLAARIAGKNETDARSAVALLIASEVARIFRLSAEEVELARPLDELGMDSMMSLDLRMGIEERFGIELPVVAISSGVSVNDIATRMIAAVRSRGAAAAEGDDAMRLIRQHGAGDDHLDDLMALTGTMKSSSVEVTLV